MLEERDWCSIVKVEEGEFRIEVLGIELNVHIVKQSLTSHGYLFLYIIYNIYKNA